MIALIPLLALASAATPSYAPAPARPPAVAFADTVRGRVTDPDGVPVAGATVTLLELGLSTRTGEAGVYAFPGVPAGRYTVRVTAPGFEPLARETRTAWDETPPIALAERGFELETFVVTATRSPGRVALSTLPVSTVGPERLRREHSVSLARTLATQPGVRALTTGEQVGKPVIRGLSGARVAVLADGLRLEDYAWSDEDAPSVDARLAERVEVVRGPASLLYGSDAVGGVVNVIPEPLPDAAAGPFARGGVETSFASGNREGGVVGRAEGVVGGLGWRATVIGRMGQDLHTPEGEIPNTGFNALNGEAAVGMNRGWGSMALRVQRYGGEFKLLEADGPPGGVTGGEEEGGPERKLEDVRVQLSGNVPLRAARIEARAQFQRHALQEIADEPAAGGPALPGEESVQFDLLLNTFTADVLAHLRGPGETIVGVSALAQANDSRGPEPLVPDAGVRSGGVFAVSQASLGPLQLRAGARVDRRALSADPNPALNLSSGHDRSWTAVSWNAGAVLSVARGLVATAGVGRAWRAPTLFELYANGPRIGEARYDVGDPALRTETGVELDAGLRWSAGTDARVEVNVFRNAVDRFIVTAPTADVRDGLRIYRTEQTDALLRGVEAQAQARVLPPLVVRGVFDYVRGTERGTGENLPLVPPARGRAEAEYRPRSLFGLGPGYLSAALERVERQTHPADDEVAPAGYTLLDLGGGIARRGVRVDLQVRNATNVAYRSFLNRYKEFAFDPGRSVVLRLATGI